MPKADPHRRRPAIMRDVILNAPIRATPKNIRVITRYMDLSFPTFFKITSIKSLIIAMEMENRERKIPIVTLEKPLSFKRRGRKDPFKQVINTTIEVNTKSLIS